MRKSSTTPLVLSRSGLATVSKHDSEAPSFDTAHPSIRIRLLGAGGVGSSRRAERVRFVLCLVLVLFILAPAAQCTDKLAALNAIIKPIHFEWRYKPGDVPNAQYPAFDDSSWAVDNSNAEFTWGDQPTAWLRTMVTIPDRISGISVAGSKVTLKIGIDDSGVLYVNGREVGPFDWDRGSFLISERAVPGEKFTIAIKCINTGGPGRLLHANLEFSALDDIRAAAASLLDAHNAARIAQDAASSSSYSARIARALDQLNTSALESGDKAGFVASAKTSEAELRAISAEITAGLTVSLIGHAHIDLAWLWQWPETIEVCKNTFSTACNLMDEYPFVFAQSQAAAYDEMKRSYPELFARIKERFKREQWDVSTAMMWSEGDTNMSCGEGIVRSMLLANRFIKREFGVEPTVGWLPDNFGHTWQLPQIFAKSGVKSICFMRCGIGMPVFWWQAPDGSRILAYNFPDYNGGIEGNAIVREALAFTKQTGISDYLKPFGVGDHGGGPTRQMLDAALALQRRTDYCKVCFSSAADYIDGLKRYSAVLPVHATELNPIFEGCYTSHADIKRGNRDSENALLAAEAFSSVAMQYGIDYPTAQFDWSWKKTCFNEFHDILCGSGIHAIYDDAAKDYAQVAAQAKSARDAALAAIVARISTKGPGIPIVVFNPLAWPRTEPVSVSSPFVGENTDVKITDSSGRSYPARTLGEKLNFTARDVPALGYKVFWANRVTSSPGRGRSGVSCDGPVIANQFFRVRIDPQLGVITAIYDKLNKRNVMVPGQYCSLLQILKESSGGMSAWNLGRIEGCEDLLKKSEVVRVDAGPAKVSVVFDHSYDKSIFTQEITLYDGVPRIDIKLTADWHEPWGGKEPTPMLKAAFSANLKNPKATFDIPFGAIERPRDGREVVAQKWIDLSDANYGLSLLNDCKYGFDVKDNTMRVSLLRSSHDPDPNPDEGVHEVTLSLYPHSGDWRAAGTVRRAYELNEPLIARVVTPHAGSLPASKSYLSVSRTNIVVTALKKCADDGNLILRFYEAHGQAGNVTVRTSLPVKYYAETDLMERQIGPKLPIKFGAFTVRTGKHEIKTYKLFTD